MAAHRPGWESPLFPGQVTLEEAVPCLHSGDRRTLTEEEPVFIPSDSCGRGSTEEAVGSGKGKTSRPSLAHLLHGLQDPASSEEPLFSRWPP